MQRSRDNMKELTLLKKLSMPKAKQYSGKNSYFTQP